MTQAREYLVPSRSQPGVRYRVVVGIDGEPVCHCAGYEFRASCWHIEYVKEHLLSDENTALVPIKVEPPKAVLPTKDELGVIGLIARSVVSAKGHAVPSHIDSSAKAAAVMLAGFELGVKPMTALRHVLVVNGRTEPDAQLMAGIVQAHEPDARIEVVELTDESCTMRLVRPSRGINAEYTYTLDDAKKAGLVKGNNPWSLYPKDMMRWAAVKRLCRAYAPDLINAVGASIGDGESIVASVAGEAPAAPTTFIDVESRVSREALYNEGDTPDSPTVGTETGEVTDEPQPEAEADVPPAADVAEGEFTEDHEPEPEPGAADEPEAAPEVPQDTAAGVDTAADDEHDATLREINAAGDWIRETARAKRIPRDLLARAVGVSATPWGQAVMAIAGDLEEYKRRWSAVEKWIEGHEGKTIADFIAARERAAAAPVEA